MNRRIREIETVRVDIVFVDPTWEVERGMIDHNVAPALTGADDLNLGARLQGADGFICGTRTDPTQSRFEHIWMRYVDFRCSKENG